jgi:hypothetical protein
VTIANWRKTKFKRRFLQGFSSRNPLFNYLAYGQTQSNVTVSLKLS